MLIFIYDKLMKKEERDKLRIPLPFLSFSYIKPYKAFYNRTNKSNIAFDYEEYTKGRGNDRILGGIYLLDERYLRFLDAYYGCSLSVFGVNSKHDRFHRKEIEATTIDFHNLDNLSNMLYNDVTKIKVHTYLGNIENKNIKNSIKQPRYRVQSGMDLGAFIDQYKEEI